MSGGTISPIIFASSARSTARPLRLPRSPLSELLAELSQALDSLRVRWYLFGAQAAILYGVSRLTADIDVTVDLKGCSSREMLARLAEAGFELRVADEAGFVETTRVLPLVHARTRIPVDVVLAGPGLEELFLAAVEERAIGDVRIPVAAAEDIVTMKVLAGRAKDLDDAIAIVKAQGAKLDLERTRVTLGSVERALDRHDLIPELERVVARARRR